MSANQKIGVFYYYGQSLSLSIIAQVKKTWLKIKTPTLK